MIQTFFSGMARGLRLFFGSSRMLPLGAAVVLFVGFLQDTAVEWVYDTWHVWCLWMEGVAFIGGVLFLVGVLGGLLVPLWLVVQTVRLCGRGDFRRLGQCWGSSALAALVAIGVGYALMMQSHGGGSDFFARGLEVPEDREFVIPRGMTFFCNYEIPPRVQALLDMKKELPPLGTQQPPGSSTQQLAAPNLQKLSREAPELLQEYMLRALYAEATDPRFNSPVLVECGLYPAHASDPQTHALRAYLSEQRIYTPEGEWTAADYPVARWTYPLENGWFVAHTAGRWDEDEPPAESPELAAELQWLDAALVPLAEHPTREQLDSLLPPIPAQPFLCIREGGPGIYHMLIVIPKGYEAGRFELRAHEVTTGRAISFQQHWHPEVRLGSVCRVICSADSLTVYSGDWGEYYGSEWEIWFTPATGGKARCVSRQPFVMMGWQR